MNIQNNFCIEVCITNDRFVMFGVTSIMPNMNGVLIQCQNRNMAKQIESYEMENGGVTINIVYDPSNDLSCPWTDSDVSIIDGRIFN